MMMQKRTVDHRSREESHSRFLVLIQASLLFAAISLSSKIQVANCEAKEFDWSDLGVSLAGSKSSLGNVAANNLRILVSPQRRASKSYELEYVNSSSPQLSSQSEANYVIPGNSNGNNYLAQTVSQLAPTHASAYSALTASLASLKNRLNARSVTLSNPVITTDSNSQANLYQSSVGSSSSGYGPSLTLADNSQQQQVQSSQTQSQPTYLSVSGSSDNQQGANVYNPPQSQGNDNKTIVLAIPAKINFLTDRTSSSAKQQQQQQLQQQPQLQQQQSQIQQQQQSQLQLQQQPQIQLQQPQQSQPQPQQLTVLQQAPNDQQTRTEYTTKQIGILNSPEATVEQPVSQLVATNAVPEQEARQYVIINSPTGQSNDQTAQLVTTNGALPQASSGVYQSIYPRIHQIAMKYIPTYQQAGPVQKIYASATNGDQVATYEVPPLSYPQANEPSQSVTRYGANSGAVGVGGVSCLDTCNSSDSRWKSYSVSKYKSCCSRSAQYDPQFEQPSLEKLGETASKYSDDAYYQYLYRRTRARRSRRPHAKYSRYNRYSSSSAVSPSASVAPTSGSDEDSLAGSDRDHGGSLDSSRPASIRSYHNESPYMKYYKNRHYGQEQSSEIRGDGGQSESQPLSSGSSKYQTKDRSYRRNRARDYESAPETPIPQDSIEEDGGSYSSSSSANAAEPASTRGSSSFGYGGGEYSVDRYSRESRSQPIEEEDSVRAVSNYDDNTELETIGTKGGTSALSEPSDYPSSDSNLDRQPSSSNNDDNDQTDTPTSTTYSSYRAHSRPRKHGSKRASRKNKESKYKKNRKAKYNNKLAEHLSPSSQTTNGTDYESAQPSEQYSTDSLTNNSEEGQSTSSYQKDSPSNEGSSEGDNEIKHHKSGMNETAVANLSKTTMQLKEILSMLEKKAQYKANETAITTTTASQIISAQPQPLPLQQSQQQQQIQQLQQQLQQQMYTSTPAPLTTTSIYSLPMMNSNYPPLSSGLNNDYLTSEIKELQLKSPYRFETSSYSSSPSLSMPSSFASMGAEPYSAIASYPPQYNLGSSKHMSLVNGPQQQRKRRLNKNTIRYNGLILPKGHNLQAPASMMNGSGGKSPFFYPSLQYPYWYSRGNSPSILNSYPYKNLNKSYSGILSGPIASKLSASAALYNDETRFHGLGGYDPLAAVASSLRPTAMRLRSKPFVFQPQVLPIYTRHTILTQPMDAKA